MYKVLYKNQCVHNPYTDVISYPGVFIGTSITAGLSTNDNDTVNIILFDKDVHFVQKSKNFYDIKFSSDIAEPSNWKTNDNDFFQTCKNTNVLTLLLQDIFSGSKRHYRLRRIAAITLVTIFTSLLFITIIIFIWNFHLKPNKSKSKENHENKTETRSVETLEQEKSPNDTALQTYC